MRCLLNSAILQLKLPFYKGRLAQNPLHCLTEFLFHTTTSTKKKGHYPHHHPQYKLANAPAQAAGAQRNHKASGPCSANFSVCWRKRHDASSGTCRAWSRMPFVEGVVLHWASISTGSQQFACLLPAGTDCQQGRGGYQNICVPHSASHWCSAQHLGVWNTALRPLAA